MPPQPALAITSIHNPRVKVIRQLATSRKARVAAQQIVVEGVRLIGDALRSGLQPLTLFYAPSLTAANPLATALIEQVAAGGAECLACAEPVFRAMAETVTPQGVLALLPLPRLALPLKPSLLLVLDGIRDPGNAGALLRSAEAAGADSVIFGPGAVDPFNDKVLRGAMGAHFRVPLTVAANWPDLPTHLAGLACFVAEANRGTPYDRIDWLTPAALVIGGEATGPGPDALALCQPIYIPMHGAPESLNAAVAGSVILFEAARQRRLV